MITSSANRGSFFPSFLVFVSFISFSFLTVIARISNTMLNDSVSMGVLALLPVLEEKLEPFATACVNSGLFVEMLFMKLRKRSFIPSFLRGFTVKGFGYFQVLFMHHCIYDHKSFLFNLLVVCTLLINFKMLNQFTSNKFHLDVAYDSF